ncbi:ABC1 kinase family protein [Desulfogranum japonicum]|uniref:ABC1 kinase family protein n=1 Tax=Desulfogranum japonicum TaxID=231447 RepID=UPI00048B9945|nr:lipopolysaccharide core heptose(II) kinase RfaY [Desulfogranum japonicum]
MDWKTLTSLGRFKDIIMVLLRYGFDDLVDRLNIPGTKFMRKKSPIDHPLDTFERIRYACEELGPTFVKFGQMASLRPDLVPPGLITELSKLQDDVAPVDMSQINAAIEQSTGKPLKETFAVFDVMPVAAASISQVHRGVLAADGRIAAVKVQRPGILAKMRADLDILAILAEQLHERVEELRGFDLPNLVRLIKKKLLRELDFRSEARHMKVARTHAGEEADVYIPEVYEAYCSAYLLVMEFIEGAKLKDFMRETIADPELMARQGLVAAINQILKHGFFHADPHPGNILIMPEGRMCLIDWGMTGRLSERDRYQLIGFLQAILDKDGEAIVHELLRIGHAEAAIDQRALERELLEILDLHYAVPIQDMNIGQLLMAVTDLLRTYRLRLPLDMVIMIKALLAAEGTARCIYPELDVVAEAKMQITQLAAQRYTAESVLRKLRFALAQLFSLQKEIPSRLESLLGKADRNELTLGFRHENLSGLIHTLENVASRVTFGIIIAAMIVGSSLIITTGVKPLLFGFPALGVIGYLFSGVLGVWLLINIIRKRKY